MPAKILTLTPKDQILLIVVFSLAVSWIDELAEQHPSKEMLARIKELKERIV